MATTRPHSQRARSTGGTRTPGRRKLLPRAERREQILRAATRAFARAGFSATSLEDVAAEADVDRMILYRHFESKADLYRAVLRRARTRMGAASGAPNYTMTSLPGLLSAAAEEPDAFRLLFRYAAREPEFRREMEDFQKDASDSAHQAIGGLIPDPGWAEWASILVPTVATEAVLAWLDAGEPDPATASDRVTRAVFGVIEAARLAPRDPRRGRAGS